MPRGGPGASPKTRSNAMALANIAYADTQKDEDEQVPQKPCKLCNPYCVYIYIIYTHPKPAETCLDHNIYIYIYMLCIYIAFHLYSAIIIYISNIYCGPFIRYNII